jgi:hypothetical protein
VIVEEEAEDDDDVESAMEEAMKIRDVYYPAMIVVVVVAAAAAAVVDGDGGVPHAKCFYSLLSAWQEGTCYWQQQRYGARRNRLQWWRLLLRCVTSLCHSRSSSRNTGDDGDGGRHRIRRLELLHLRLRVRYVFVVVVMMKKMMMIWVRGEEGRDVRARRGGERREACVLNDLVGAGGVRRGVMRWRRWSSRGVVRRWERGWGWTLRGWVYRVAGWMDSWWWWWW